MAASSNIEDSSEGLFVLYTFGVHIYVANPASQGRLLILIEKLNEHKEHKEIHWCVEVGKWGMWMKCW